MSHVVVAVDAVRDVSGAVLGLVGGAAGAHPVLAIIGGVYLLGIGYLLVRLSKPVSRDAAPRE